MFKKILIANRGEIAVRVIRACHELGIKAVAVYSEVDRASLHVLKADEAHHIGAAAASESYLDIRKIIDVAKRTGAQAIHPGYGFLSENAKFAQTCAEAGVKFIGPNAAAMELMGSKTRARQQMEKAGVPCVPGTSRGLESFGQAERVAEEIGYPLMLKAAAGGGGKGMRLVRSREELKPALESAKSEALRAFGDSEVYVEKLIANPRHIEVQVLADEHGNVVHLGERECSIQRRHQKVQEDVHIRGYAIECRIYAEDPDNNYFPSPGKISLLLTPDGPGVRHDSGMYEGWTVPIDYDPLLAKLIGYGSDRAQAVSRLRRALDEYLVGGIKTNISLFRRILGDQDFQAGKPDTGYLDRLLHTTQVSSGDQHADAAAIAAGIFATLDSASATANGVAGDRPAVATASTWKQAARIDGLRQ